MESELTPEDIQDVLDMGSEFETWFNEQVKKRPVVVAHLLHVMGLAYARLRLQCTVTDTQYLVERKFAVMERLLADGMRVKIGPELDVEITLPVAEERERNPGIRDMLASLTETDDELDAEIEELLERGE